MEGHGTGRGVHHDVTKPFRTFAYVDAFLTAGFGALAASHAVNGNTAAAIVAGAVASLYLSFLVSKITILRRVHRSSRHLGANDNPGKDSGPDGTDP